MPAMSGRPLHAVLPKPHFLLACWARGKAASSAECGVRNAEFNITTARAGKQSDHQTWRGHCGTCRVQAASGVGPGRPAGSESSGAKSCDFSPKRVTTREVARRSKPVPAASRFRTGFCLPRSTPRHPQVALLQDVSVPLKERAVCRKVTSELYFLCSERLAAREGRKT
jgi:hypothetical protein